MTALPINMSAVREKISSACHPFASRFGLVMIFGLPWSHAFFYIGLVGFLFCLLVSTTRYKELLIASKEPIALLALLLFVYIAAGLLYSHAPYDLGIFDVKKYRKLLLIPLFLAVFRDIRCAKKMVLAYSLGVLSLMTPTLLDGTGLMQLLGLDMSRYRDGSYSAESLVYWRNHIVHGFHVSMLFTIGMLSAFHFQRLRWLSIAVAALCVYDILFFIHGRMALIGLLSVFGLLVFHLITQRRLQIVLLTAVIAASALTYEFSSKVQRRIDSVTQETQAYREDHNFTTSGGQRLYLWAMSFQLFRSSPILGAGPGAFREKLVQPDSLMHDAPYHHTHNEYLTLASQHGLIGLILFLSLAWTMYRNAGRRQDLWLQGIVRIGIAIFLINALTDSSLHNESEGWTFVVLACLANMSHRSARKI